MHRRRFAAALVILLLTTSACGSSGNDEAAAPDAGAQAGPGAEAGRVLLQSSAGQPRERRDVVYTGELVVRVSSVGKATQAATKVASAKSGFVFAQTTDEVETKLTVKVPSDQFDATVDAMSKLGKELRRNLKAQDVTAEVVDVEGRLKTAQTSADRLRALLADAKTPADVVAIEGELSKRETDIETLQGRLRVLNDQVSLATLTVRLTERNDLKVANDLPGFLGGLRTGIFAVINVGQVLLVVLGFMIPFVPIVALVVWAWRRYRRGHSGAPRRPPGPPYWPPQTAQPPAAAGQSVAGAPSQTAAPPTPEA